jgi:murein DD-endopeptidase MepM/ murein hydrolase activator NlpD
MIKKIIIENLQNNLIKVLFILFIFKINPCLAKETLTLDYNNTKVFLEGDFIQGGLVKGKTDNNISLKFKKRLLRKTPKGLFVFGFGRDHPQTANLSLKINQKWITKNINIKKRVYKTQIINGLEKKMVTPPKSFYDRIIRENKVIKEIRNLDSDIDFIFQKLNWPAKGIISGVFGSQRILNGKPKRPHYGIDIAAKKGTSVIAPIESIVRMAEKDLYYTGGTIMLDHGHGVTSVYSHLSLINVNVGDKVKKGQKIGEIGSTGRSTGPHLDWRINWFLERLDPALLVP